jgi:hypothetical protein
MKIKKPIISFVALVLILSWLAVKHVNKMQRVDEFRKVKVGQRCPTYWYVKRDLQEKGISAPGKFIVFFISEELDNPDGWELDNRSIYGKTTDFIVKKEGHFWPCGEPKIAEMFGIDHVLSRTRSLPALARDVTQKMWLKFTGDLIWESVCKWELDGSLITVTDGKGKILALYKNARLEDIENIVDNI